MAPVSPAFLNGETVSWGVILYTVITDNYFANSKDPTEAASTKVDSIPYPWVQVVLTDLTLHKKVAEGAPRRPSAPHQLALHPAAPHKTADTGRLSHRHVTYCRTAGDPTPTAEILVWSACDSTGVHIAISS